MLVPPDYRCYCGLSPGDTGMPCLADPGEGGEAFCKVDGKFAPMSSIARPTVLSRLPSACKIVLIAAAGAAINPIYAGAADGNIYIELNAAQTVEGACHTSFTVRNELAHTLDRFRLDLHVIGVGETLKTRTNIDLAPLRNAEDTAFTFRILAEPCDAIAKILVHDIPKCRAAGGSPLNCVDGLTVKSRHRIKLVKNPQ